MSKKIGDVSWISMSLSDLSTLVGNSPDAQVRVSKSYAKFLRTSAEFNTPVKAATTKVVAKKKATVAKAPVVEVPAETTTV